MGRYSPAPTATAVLAPEPSVGADNIAHAAAPIGAASATRLVGAVSAAVVATRASVMRDGAMLTRFFWLLPRRLIAPPPEPAAEPPRPMNSPRSTTLAAVIAAGTAMLASQRMSTRKLVGSVHLKYERTPAAATLTVVPVTATTR